MPNIHFVTSSLISECGAQALDIRMNRLPVSVNLTNALFCLKRKQYITSVLQINARREHAERSIKSRERRKKLTERAYA